MIYVNIIGIAILTIFSLFIITKKGKVLSDYLLLLCIFLFSGILVTGILLEYNLSVIVYVSFLFFNSFIFPSIVVYGLVLLNEQHKFKIQWLWTASYAIIFILIIAIDTLIFNSYDSINQLHKFVENPSLFYNLLYKGQYVFVIAILIWLINKLNNYNKKLKNIFSKIESIHLNWFKNFAYIYLFVNLISLILFVLLDFDLVSDISTPLLIEHTILTAALFYLCFHGIKQYNLAELSNINIEKENLKSSEPSTKKYSSSSMSIEEMQVLFSRVEKLFIEDAIYLDSDLKIDTIAKTLNVTTQRISQTINTIAAKPFYDYVNAFRVNHLKQLLANLDNNKFTILALAVESGFNSKATLNRVFKQQVGMTPKSFQKSQALK